MKILKGKIFWFLVCFALSSLALLLNYPIIGAILMVYPVGLTLVMMAFGFVINPYREYKIRKFIEKAPNAIGGFVRDEHGNPIRFAKVAICDPKEEPNIYLSQCYAVTDNIGHFWINNIIDGEWQVICHGKGYGEYNEIVKFEKQRTVFEKITLETL